ncbi:MAG: TlpA disulfide reductase family protein [Pseudomonadota bacterium]
MPASVATSATPSSKAAHPVVKVSFVVMALLLLAGLVALKVREYVRYLEFSTQAVMDPLPLDRMAPGFSLPPGPSGAPIQLEALRDQYVLVHFWATWCPPCREELRTLEYLARGRKDTLRVLAITVDDDWSEVQRFFGNQSPTFALAWDRQRETAEAYGTQKFPETYLVDPQGKLVAKFMGARDWNSKAAYRYLDEMIQR